MSYPSCLLCVSGASIKEPFNDYTPVLLAVHVVRLRQSRRAIGSPAHDPRPEYAASDTVKLVAPSVALIGDGETSSIRPFNGEKSHARLVAFDDDGVSICYIPLEGGFDALGQVAAATILHEDESVAINERIVVDGNDIRVVFRILQ
ncbi:MAG: hypothetical protein HOI95_29355 [Chromatiales bacterium]|jgi:hypothetical protein|nr:hypothetical protein [Chromatiales bacterium]